MTAARFFDKVNSILKDGLAVIADVGDTLFGAADLVVPKHSFVGSAFYASMGSAIPGALGMCLARPEFRQIVLVGDGAFQMSCSELSTFVAKKLNPIIFVLNNHGYTTERYLLDGSYNNIAEWEYHKITSLVNGGIGVKVETEEELEIAVNNALTSKELYVINVLVNPTDQSPGLKRMTDGLSKMV
jgi:indolepyruvate decarboxylase